MKSKSRIFLLLASLLTLIFVITGCGTSDSEKDNSTNQPEPKVNLEGKLDPAEWAGAYPNHYESYLKNSETGSEHSKYRGSDAFDRNSAWPFQWVLYDGWGMGNEYTESRGHVFAIHDQLEIDPSRRAAGGSCLTCKSPAVPALKEKMGTDYFSKPFDEVYKEIPQQYNAVGVACIDCHDPKTNELTPSRWTLTDALAKMEDVPSDFNKSQKATLACAQCHVTYSIPKDENKKSLDVLFPWSNSKWGAITIEDIEKQIKAEGLYEWTNEVTGLKLGHIRHPEFEFFSNNSTHSNMGLSCASCHMPDEEMNGENISSHQWTSPFKQGMTACIKCHSGQTPEQLKDKVIAIQDKTNELFTEAGFESAQAAKAIEMANKTKGADERLLEEAKLAYEKSYYRVVFIGAENSMGFHNPQEADRVLKDGLKFALEANQKARQAMEKAGVKPPATFDLELDKYPYDPSVNKSHNKREQ